MEIVTTTQQTVEHTACACVCVCVFVDTPHMDVHVNIDIQTHINPTQPIQVESINLERYK